MTPQQMRELADMSGALAYHDRDRFVAESAAALRAAANQLEAVHAKLAAIHAVEWEELPIESDSWVKWGQQVDAILTADTAPQSHD